MALTLVARAADPQALKALLAAKLGGKDVAYKVVTDLAAGPFGSSRLQLQGNGFELSEANAIAELLGEFWASNDTVNVISRLYMPQSVMPPRPQLSTVAWWLTAEHLVMQPVLRRPWRRRAGWSGRQRA